MTETATPSEAPEAPATPRITRPTTTPRLRRVATTGLLALFVVVLSAGCTVPQMRAWWASQGTDSSHLSDAEVQPWADAAGAFWANWFAEQERLARFDHVLSEDQLHRLRMCESGGNYGALSHGGTYRGAYQFSRTTWDGVARQHFPEYVGIDPATADPRVQDVMTRALWSTNGPRPWPVCGYRV
jgi:hypothetical protein